MRHAFPYLLDATGPGWKDLPSAWSEMRGYVERGRSHVCVPEVVVQELVRAYRRVANNLLGKIQELKPRALKQLLALDMPLAAELKHHVDARNDAYEATLRARLVELGAEIVPFSAVAHQELLTRALHNRRPFDGQGKNGYWRLDHCMWIGTHHPGRLYFRAALNEDGSAVEETDLHHAEENVPRRPNDHLVPIVVIPSG